MPDAPDTILGDLRRRVAAQINLEQEGLDRYRVFTPFQFDDGDHLAVVLKREPQIGWVFSDEGHTLMRLTYSIDEKQLHQGNRAMIIESAVEKAGIDDAEGELRLPVPQERWGDALFTYVQALLRVSDVALLSRQRVQSTFMEDVADLLGDVVPRGLIRRDWANLEHDPDRLYEIDFRVGNGGNPLYVFALGSDTRTDRATISLLQHERWGEQFTSLGLFEEQEKIGRKTLARFSGVCERQFPSLGDRDRIVEWIRDRVPA